MAWLETDRHGRLRIAFKYYDGRTYREPLGVEASKRTRVDAERFELHDSTRNVGWHFRLCETFSQQRTHKKIGSQAT
jgi:hypothetical protein